MNHIEKLKKVDLNLLTVLDVLLETSSLQATAKHLGRTPSAVSHALAKLRELFSDPLVVRSANTMVRTPTGAALAPLVRRALRQTEALFAPMHYDPKVDRRRFRVMTSDYASVVILQPLVAHILAESPAVDIEVMGVGTETDAAVRRGDVSLALGAAADFRRSQPVCVEPIFTESFSTAWRKSHPVGCRPACLNEWLAFPHMLVAPRGQPGSYVDRALAAEGQKRRVRFQTQEFLTACLAVSRTDGIITAPTRLLNSVRKDFNLYVSQPPIELPRYDIVMVYARVLTDDPAEGWFRQQMVQQARATTKATPEPLLAPPADFEPTASA